MIKVVDGCGFNNRYWVFFAALTNVEFHITVRDTWQNFEKAYDNAARRLRRRRHRHHLLRDLSLTARGRRSREG